MTPAAATEDAELVAGYLVARIARDAGTRLCQGARKIPLATTPLGPALDLMATTRLRGVPEPVAETVVAWGQGELRVHRLGHVPTPAEVLAWQAQGERCVSLLPDEVAARATGIAGVKADARDPGLAFALHDLCHLGHFVDPAHHDGQVGFFAALHRASTRPEWTAFLARGDATLAKEIDHVAADMNGSAVFLFAALKMKLKMAVRRRVGEARGQVRVSGALDDDEHAAFDVELEALTRHLGLTGAARDGALRVSTRRDAEVAASALLAHFEAEGAAVKARWRAVS